MLFFKYFRSSLSSSLSHIHIVRCIMYTWYNLRISHAYVWLRFEDAVHVFRFVWYHYPTLFCWEGPSACDFYWVECWLHFGPSLSISWSRLMWAVTRGNIVLLSPKQPQNNQSPASPKAEEEIKTPQNSRDSPQAWMTYQQCWHGWCGPRVLPAFHVIQTD